MQLQESGEMYLEAILVLSNEKTSIRAIDVVEYMGFSKPAVSRALSRLREEGLILTDDSGYLLFTEKGRGIAENIYRKHVLLTKFIEDLGVDSETASTDACRIEHVISDKTFDAIVRHAREHSHG